MPSPSKNKRASLRSQFPGLDITSQASSSADKAPRKMSSCIIGTFSKGWPSSLRKSAATPTQNMRFTLKMSDQYRVYGSGWRLSKTHDEPANVTEDFNYATGIQEEIVAMVEQKNIDSQLLEEVMIEQMCIAIYGSNLIERSGSNLDETIKLCMAVFRGEEGLEWTERTPEYQQRLDKHAKKDVKPGEEAVLRSRREVIQHAAAFQYMVHEFVKHEKPMTEELIKETHKILVTGLDTSAAGVISSKTWAGTYRAGKEKAFAGTHQFASPANIPKEMNAFVKRLQEDMENVEKLGVLDPYILAAQYCDRFVQIHPFKDGNGRMCRLILNAIVIKYAGHVVILGENGAERDKYLSIASESSKVGGHAGQLGKMVLEKAKEALQTMKINLMEKMKAGTK